MSSFFSTLKREQEVRVEWGMWKRIPGIKTISGDPTPAHKTSQPRVDVHLSSSFWYDNKCSTHLRRWGLATTYVLYESSPSWYQTKDISWSKNSHSLLSQQRKNSESTFRVTQLWNWQLVMLEFYALRNKCNNAFMTIWHK